MEILINLLKSSALLGFFFIIYYVFLRTDTFYQFKRVYFYVGLVLSVVLPWIYFTKTVIIETTLSTPIILSQGNSPLIETATASVPIEAPIDWYQIIFYVYLAITAVVLLWYLIRYFKIFLELNGSQFEDKSTYKLHITSDEVGPFSFFNHIVINKQDYKSDHYNFILAHEATHTKEWHSLDVMITNLACALFWFNPVMWLYRKHWLQNLEHIADQAAIKYTDKTAYQYLLLNSALGQSNTQLLTTTFFQPSIKQRIMMLNKPKTPQLLSIKSLMVVPLLLLFIFHFQTKTVAQEKDPSEKFVLKSDSNKNTNTLNTNSVIVVKITKDSSKDYLETTKSMLKKFYGIDIEYSDIKYNDDGKLISIHLDVNCNDGFKGTVSQTFPFPLNDIYIYRDYTNSSKSPFGVGSFSESEILKIMSVEGQDVKIILISPENTKTKVSDSKKMVMHTEVVIKSELLDNVETFIINGEDYEVEDLQTKTLLVKSFEFLNDKTLKVTGELYDDFIKANTQDGELYFENIDMIFFSKTSKPIFMHMKKVRITNEQKSE